MSLQALFGTRTAADINLVAQILMLVGLFIGFAFIRRGDVTRHKNTQTAMVLTNLFFIAFVMVSSFYNYVVVGRTTTGTTASLMLVHGVLGLAAELTGIYLILRMRTQVIPKRFRVRNFKRVMRGLLALWTTIVVIGVALYITRYVLPSEATSAVIAGDQRSVMVTIKDFKFQPASLTIAKGTTVTFVNLDAAPHTVTSDDSKVSSGRMEVNKTFAVTFTEPATVAYYCEFHGSKGGVDMAAKIVVGP